MSSAANLIQPEYVRLSGEIADQAILNHLRSVYPKARIVHAFASTEAGVAFEVHDETAGFVESVIADAPGVEMKIQDRTLRIRSERSASRYLGDHAPILKGEDGFVDTGDIVELREGRYYFAGRRDGMINVGGMKVYPEEIETVINRHPEVRMSLVRTKKNPITGALVVADVVLKAAHEEAARDLGAVQDDILLLCRECLAPHKIPAQIKFVPEIAVGASGKVQRNSA
jgi:acyl-coenzyme A synthetase/AMP-(fatty) acid ligase